SDYSVTQRGVNLSATKVRCGTSGNNSVSLLQPGESVDGVLLGSQDVVYFRLPTGPGSTDVYGVTMRGLGGAGTDFDLIAKCGTTLTASNTEPGGQSGTSHEVLDLPDTCTSGWLVGVHAWSGSGVFKMHVARRRSSEHDVRLTVGL